MGKSEADNWIFAAESKLKDQKGDEDGNPRSRPIRKTANRWPG
jgi:hypothetical protein